MKKFLLLCGIILTSVLPTIAKTTYIPKYRSYIHITNGTDTISVTDSIRELNLIAQNGMFQIRVEHEEVDKEKVKSIKRAKRAAGWMAFSAALSSVSTALSSNNLQYYVRSQNAKFAIMLTDMYNRKVDEEQKLETYIWIDNLSEEEIMINDTERGRLWYIRPHHSLNIQVYDPDVSMLRISDIHNSNVSYALTASGNYTLKWEVEWEDENYWIVPVYKDTYNEYRYDKLSYYKKIWKNTFIEEDMDIQVFQKFKEEETMKRKKKKKEE